MMAISGAGRRAISAKIWLTSALDSGANSSVSARKYRKNETGRFGCASSAGPKSCFTSVSELVVPLTLPTFFTRAAA